MWEIGARICAKSVGKKIVEGINMLRYQSTTGLGELH